MSTLEARKLRKQRKNERRRAQRDPLTHTLLGPDGERRIPSEHWAFVRQHKAIRKAELLAQMSEEERKNEVEGPFRIERSGDQHLVKNRHGRTVYAHASRGRCRRWANRAENGA